MGSSGGSDRAAVQAAQIQSGAATQVARINADAALQAAQIGQSTSLQAAEIAAGGSVAAAHAVAGAQAYAADLGFEAASNSLAEQRRQFDNTVERFAPYVELGEQFIGDITEAATVEGLDARIAQILSSDSFSALRDKQMQSANNQLAQAGVTRSGAAARAAAEMDINVASAIENQLYGRQMTNLQIGQASAAQTSAAGAGYANAVTGINQSLATNVGGLAVQSAQAQGQFLQAGAQAGAQGILNAGNAASQGILGAASANAAGIQGAANATANGLVNSANAQSQQRQNRLSGAMAGAMAGWQTGTGWWGAAIGAVGGYFFSDERLKENMQPIGKIHDLTLYEWDWKPGARMAVGTEMSTGFKAQEVAEKYPECVDDTHGLLIINYPLLHETLQQRLAA